MPLTDDDVKAKIGTLAKNNRALMFEIFERLDTLPATPSPEVFAASSIVMAAITAAIAVGTDESNMAMLARVTAAIQEQV